MARSGADVGEAEFLEERSHITLVKIDAECLSDDALEVYGDYQEFRVWPERLNMFRP